MIGRPIFYLVAACGLLGPTISEGQSVDTSQGTAINALRGIAPGAIGTYAGTNGVRVQRIDRELHFDWGRLAPDPRLAPAGFTAHWRAVLQVPADGEYRFAVYVQGECELTLDGHQVLVGQRDDAGWLIAPTAARTLTAGDHQLQVRFRKRNEHARLSIFWEGPKFWREPLGRFALAHDTGPLETDRFHEGWQLAREARCDACHQFPPASTPLPAPALDRLAGTMRRTWLIDALTQKEQLSEQQSSNSETNRARPTHWPRFPLTEAQATTIADALLAHSAPRARAEGTAEETAVGDAGRGRQLFFTLGCLACHTLEKLGPPSDRDLGGPLDYVADKRPNAFFEQWLVDPASINADHRMPRFELSLGERRDLAAYLQTLSLRRNEHASHVPAQAEHPARVGITEPETIRARRLIAEFQCQACHRLPESLQSDTRALAKRPLNDVAAADSCLTPWTTRPTKRPYYALSDPSRAAIGAFLASAMARDPTLGNAASGPFAVDAWQGERRLRELGCANCHARGEMTGMEDIVLAVARHDSEYEQQVPAMIPPTLDGVGEKLTDQAIHSAIDLPNEPRRPWLAVRMPKYRLRAEERDQLVQYFVRTDRLPELPSTWRAGGQDARDVGRARWSDVQWQAAGSRLVTTDGFGCTSCHAIGGVAPTPGALNTRGPNLSNLGGRVRHAWFERWVRNPLRVVPRVEMPAIELPVPGVLENRLDDQIASLWHVLNKPDFQPPRPDAVRIVRQRGEFDASRRAEVLTDVVRHGDTELVKPLLIALPNRHNVLIDLERNQLFAWFIGDAARQRNEGKVWYWEAAGIPLGNWSPSGGDIVIFNDRRVLAPEMNGQARAELDAWQHENGGVVFDRRLTFAGLGDDASVARDRVVHVREHILPLWNDQSPASDTSHPRGWERRIELRGVPRGWRVRLQVIATRDLASWEWDPASHALRFDSPREATEEPSIVVSVDHSDAVTWDAQGALVSGVSEGADGKPVNFGLQYRTSLAVDPYLVPPFPQTASERASIDAVPGFQAWRLSLPSEIMPTAIDASSDGSLVIASLKGRVWRANDTDGDRLHDVARVISDELAAPYGVACHEAWVDVVTKYGVVRLSDWDAEGRAQRSEIVASGWGHTSDYHDWAVGLPSDAQGNYWVALPCQQDQRSAAAARHRGRLLQLVPRTPSADQPRRFALVEWTAGHRFPMGLARNREGVMVVTDNQGNYNPFNELNHVVRGSHYGFINALESAQQFADQPATSPAVAIPHPWTRSVNGICFLQTPAGRTSEGTEPMFGPFEGHIVGCEYDTRRLIRISLQEVDGVLQGAVYPMSVEGASPASSLLGPVNCAIGPDGMLWIAELRDAGWGAGPNIGAITRLEFDAAKLPVGIAEVTTTTQDGFRIRWTRPIAPGRTGDRRLYSVASYTRIATPKYGGEDVQRREEPVLSVQPDADGQSVTLRLEELREGFVYELRVSNPLPDEPMFFPAEAHVTVRRVVAEPD